LEDVSHKPIDDKSDLGRNYLLLEELPRFINRLNELPTKPAAVVVILKQIGFFVKYAVERANLEAEIEYLPFPLSPGKSRKAFVNGLSRILREKGLVYNCDMDKALSNLLDYCKLNNRVCPRPIQWDELWKLLPDRKRDGFGWQPPIPLILAGWWESDNSEKQRRLFDHIQWAYDHGILEKVDRYLRSLSEDQWHHVGD
jgi:hypothetical protein